MKNTIKIFLYGATLAFGIQAGADAYNKLKNPVTRKNIKNKFTKIKDTVFGKEES